MGSLQRSANPLTGFKGATFKERAGKGRERDEQRGNKGKEREGWKDREGKGEGKGGRKCRVLPPTSE